MFNFIKRIFRIQEEEVDAMKYLIAGLGNMHPDYNYTRHNVGFEVVDALAEKHGGKWKNDTQGDIAEIKFRGRTMILLKPSTYMNRSGKSVNYWMQKKKILPENLVVVTDDKNISFGSLKLKGKGSDGGHNGLKDIIQMIGNKFSRLRVGIGSDFSEGRQVDFVLGRWTEQELKTIPKILDQAVATIESYAAIGLQRTMNQFNGKDVK